MHNCKVPDFTEKLGEFRKIKNFEHLAKLWQVEKIREKFRRVVVRLSDTDEQQVVSGPDFINAKNICESKYDVARRTYERCIDGVFTSLHVSPDNRIVFRGIKPCNGADFNAVFPVIRDNQFQFPDAANTFISMYREIDGNAQLFELTSKCEGLGGSVALNTYDAPVHVEKKAIIPFLTDKPDMLTALLKNPEAAAKIQPYLNDSINDTRLASPTDPAIHQIPNGYLRIAQIQD